MPNVALFAGLRVSDQSEIVYASFAAYRKGMRALFSVNRKTVEFPILGAVVVACLDGWMPPVVCEASAMYLRWTYYGRRHD